MGILSSLFGIGGSKPKQETVVQSAQIPPELAPFVKQILGEAQDLYEGEIERGYEPYTGLTSAPFTAEEEAAQAGIAGLVGTATPYIEEAVGTYREGAEKFTPETAQEYMSPYQRAVTDIEKREAQRVFERDVMPRFEAEAVQAGGLSGLGTRAGVQAAELQRNQQQLLADIEAKGLQSAFQDARQAFETQKARERQMAGDVGRTGPALFQAGLAERGAQMGVGEQKRQQAQTALDEAYFRFLEERGFPQQTLADYSQTVYGNPVLGTPSVTKQTTEQPFVSSPASQLMGLGLSGLNLYGMGGGFSPGNFSMGNLYARPGMGAAAQGGQVESTLPVIKRAAGRTVGFSPTSVPAWRRGPGATSPNLPTNYNQILANVFKQLSDKQFATKANDPLLGNITRDVNKLDYFDPEKRAIPSRQLQTKLRNQRTVAREASQAIADQRKEKLGEISDPYFEGQKELAGKVNVGEEVGAELRKDRPEGETPIELLTKTMGAAGEGAGKQITEGFNKLAEIRKEKYTDDKGEVVRESDRLLEEANLDNATEIELIKNQFNLDETIAKLPIEKQKYIFNQVDQVRKSGNLTLNRLNTLASFIKAMATAQGTAKGGKDHVSAMRIMNNAIGRNNNVTINYDQQGNMTGIADSQGKSLSNKNPAHIKINREFMLRNKKFLDMLQNLGRQPTRTDIIEAQNAATNWAGGKDDPPMVDFFNTYQVYRTTIIDNADTQQVKARKTIQRNKAIQDFANKYYNGDAVAAQAYLLYKIDQPEFKAFATNP